MRYKVSMKKLSRCYLLAIVIILFSSVFVCADNDDGSKYYNMYLDFYHSNHYKTGITLIMSINSALENSNLLVNHICEGEVYDKYAGLFEGKISVYEIYGENETGSIDILEDDKWVMLVIPDEEVDAYKTADIYYVDELGNIKKLHTTRNFQGDANQAHITAFGTFIVTNGTLKVTETIPPTLQATEKPQIQGDINSDNKVDATDALAVLKHVAKLDEIGEDKLLIADMNSDEFIDSEDALSILKIAAKLI